MNDFDKQIAEIYREMELHLIQSMKRNLALHIAEEGKTGITYPQWQAIKLKELKRYQRQNKRIVDKYTRGLPKEIAQHMKDELDQGAMSQFKLHKEALGAGYKSAKLMKDSFFKVDDRAVSALIDSLQNDMATANSAVLRMVNDVYRETIFKSAMFVKNGVYTEKQAYDMAIKSFLEKGINCIQYKDGRRVNIADYAEMAVRTASQRAHLAGQGEFRKEIGRTLILISRHNTACELCKPFQHKVLIDDVYSGGKPEDGDCMLLSEAMKLGLYHPRCRHGCGTYYPELEEINHYETEDNKLNEYSDDKINAAHVENMIQKYKRLSLGSTLPENIAKYREKRKYWEDSKQALVDKKTQDDIIKKQIEEIKMVQNALNPEEYFVSKFGTLPNAFAASTPQEKLQGYLLNDEHISGCHKARVIESVLGFNKDNWNELADYIYNAVQKNGVSDIQTTKFGKRYKVPIRVYGKKGKSMVLTTVWQIDNGSNIPRFITSTFKKSTIREMK